MRHQNGEPPVRTNVYITGPELEGAWKYMLEKNFGSLSWAVRVLVKEGLRAHASEESADEV